MFTNRNHKANCHVDQWSRLHKPQPQGKLPRGPVESSSQTATTRQTATWTSGVVFTNCNHKANCHVDQWSRVHKPQPQGKLPREPVESSSQTATTRQTATWTSGVVFTNCNHKANCHVDQWSRVHKPQPQGKLPREPVESSSQTATTRQTATWTSGVVFTNRNHKANCHVNQWNRLHKPQPQGKLPRGPVESSSQTATTRQTAT